VVADVARVQRSRFGELLLRYRRATGLTQEELAAKSGMSVRALSNLERGRAGGAQRRSAESLADALGLAGEQRTEFVGAAATARQRGTGGTATHAPRNAVCASLTVVADFIGRERELVRLRAWVRDAVDAPSGSVISIVGPPGIGKTTLAAAATRRLADEFPDGCLALDLRGMDDRPLPTGTALDRMLRSLGVDASQIPYPVDEQVNLFRSMLVGRRMLVLLDNATDEAQVRPLLAAGQGCVTLITCRRALSGLEGARWLWLAPLAAPHAVELLASIADTMRVRSEPDAARELAELCGNLPLALRIAGNRLARQPHWSVAGLTAQLRDERTRLTALTAGDLQVRSAFAVSYQELSAPAQRVFRRLALVPGADFGAELAAVAASTDHADAQQRIEELVNATLVQPAATPGRYQFHDLIRIFARERLESEEPALERDHAAGVVYSHLLSMATASGRLFDPETEARAGAREEAGAWLEREASNWIAAVSHASTTCRHRELVALARAMHWFSDANQQYPWVDIFGRGVAAARAVGDRHAEAALLNFLGWAQGAFLGDPELQRATHGQALTLAADIGDLREQAWALGYLGSVLTTLGSLVDALDHIQRATARFTELGYWPALNSTRNAEGRILRKLGRHDEALAAHRAVLADLDHRDSELEPSLLAYHRAVTLAFIGEVKLDLRDWDCAAVTFHEARDLVTARDLPAFAGECGFHEGTALRRAGRDADAIECLDVALTLLTGVTARWQRARALVELAGALHATGADEWASEVRGEALALCEELGTDEARALAADLSGVPG
jgi:transcriptional regulator with XRE-family HTH domain/tetratricopeptide (TPR) repeat protein